jgi:hypothetical protein
MVSTRKHAPSLALDVMVMSLPCFGTSCSPGGARTACCVDA